MVAKQTDTTSTADREIVTKRTFDAPRELVFKAWTDPEHIGEWWGPTGFTTTTSEMDVRPGGTWRFIMHGPDGVDYPNLVTYIEVEPPERLVYTHGDDDGDMSVQFVTTVTLVDRGGKTELTMQALFATAAERDRVIAEVGAIEGANQTLGRLAEYLAQK